MWLYFQNHEIPPFPTYQLLKIFFYNQQYLYIALKGSPKNFYFDLALDLLSPGLRLILVTKWKYLIRRKHSRPLFLTDLQLVYSWFERPVSSLLQRPLRLQLLF